MTFSRTQKTLAISGWFIGLFFFNLIWHRSDLHDASNSLYILAVGLQTIVTPLELAFSIPVVYSILGKVVRRWLWTAMIVVMPAVLVLMIVPLDHWLSHLDSQLSTAQQPLTESVQKSKATEKPQPIPGAVFVPAPGAVFVPDSSQGDESDVTANIPPATAAESGDNTPSLRDTWRWMQNTLDSGAGSLYMRRGAEDEIEKHELTLLGGAASCQITFSYQEGPLEKNSFGIIKQPSLKMTKEFNLKDIDPNTIESGKRKLADTIGPYVLFFATTTNNAPIISNLLDFYHDGHHESTFDHSDSLTFELPYPYAERFTKAFKHAVELCGGKRSSF